MITVVHLVGRLGVGGVERWLERIQPLACEHMRFVYGVNIGGGQIENSLVRSGAKIFVLGRFSAPGQYLPAAVKLIRQVMRDGGACILHIHTQEYAWLGIVAAFIAGGKHVIVHSHNDRVPHRLISLGAASLLLSRLLCFLPNIVAAGCSLSARRVLFPFHRNRKYLTVPYCLPPETLTAVKSAKRRAGRIPGELVLCCVGRLVPQKNQAFAIKVLRELVSRGVNARLLILGDGPLRDCLVALGQKLRLGDRVYFPGLVQDVVSFLAENVDVFIFPSMWEGFPVAMLEAQAAGVPIVCSSSISSEVRVAPGYVTALAATDSCIPQWATAVLNCAPPPPLERQGMAESVWLHYSPAASWNRLHALYRSSILE